MEIPDFAPGTKNSGLPTPHIPLRGSPHSGLREVHSKNQRFSRMKSPSIENIVVDEVHERTYIVMAHRVLADGELYKAIRLELMKRGSPVARGESLIITAPKP
jgi:hypothetical protein